jgi:mRNA-degrading endonuclease RelE of RelBE toxin-antitoxin system
MKFEIKTTNIFLEQVKRLRENDKKIIKDKIELLKQNPYRFKRIHSKRFSRVFRVRLNVSGKEMRLIYVLLAPNIIIVCLIERKNDYKDLEKYLEKI